MPFRLGNVDPKWFDRTKVQFTTSSRMPYDVYQACLRTGTVSNTVYIQHAVCEALARDLDLSLDDLLGALPPPRGPSGHLYDPDQHTMDRFRPITEDHNGGVIRIGPANTVEEVR